MKIFKNKIIQSIGLVLLVIVIWNIFRFYPQSTITLQNVQQQPQIIINFTSPKDFGTRGFFEVNSRLFCNSDDHSHLTAWNFIPTGQEYIGFIEKMPAQFDSQQQRYIYHISLDLDEQQRQEIQNKKLQCRVMTGHYLRGFIRSNVIEFTLNRK